MARNLDNTIKLTIYLYTDGLPNLKEAYNEGVVFLRANKKHRINASEKGSQFDDLDDLPNKVRMELKKGNVEIIKKK